MKSVSRYLIISEKNKSDKILHRDKKELIGSIKQSTKLEIDNNYIHIEAEKLKYELKTIQIEQDNPNKSNFILIVDFDDKKKISQFEFLDNEIHNFVDSYSDLSVSILEDAISQYYSKEAYELIHIVENKTRALISEVMSLKSDNLSWENLLTNTLSIRDTRRSQKNGKYKPLDGKYFSDLTKILFTIYDEKKDINYNFSDIIENLDNLIQKLSNESKDNFEVLKDAFDNLREAAPQSIWDKYIAPDIEKSKKISNNLTTVLKQLEDPRNKIAHNTIFRAEDYNDLKQNVEKVVGQLDEAIEEFENKAISMYSPEAEKEISNIFDGSLNGEQESLDGEQDSIDDLTIIVPARKEGFEQVFMNENQWYDVRISEEKRKKIRYIAAYEVAPRSGIQYIAEVEKDGIIPSDNYIGYWKIKFKEGSLHSYPEIKKNKGAFPPRNIIYVSKKKLDEADNLDDLLKSVKLRDENKKFYAVRQGRVPGIYTTWSEAEAQVKGFSNAVYKGFKTLDEANEFLKL